MSARYPPGWWAENCAGGRRSTTGRFETWDDWYRSVGVPEEGMDHYAVAMLDPEGNEFDIN